MREIDSGSVILTRAEYEEFSKTAKKAKRQKSKQEPMRVRNRVLVLLGLFIVAFIVSMIVIFCVKGSVPDTLIQYTLGAGGVEAVALAAITISDKFTGGKG